MVNVLNLNALNGIIRYMDKVIEDTIKDLIKDLLYYDRKEDEDLPPGVIEQQLNDGILTVEEIVEVFNQELQRITGD